MPHDLITERSSAAHVAVLLRTELEAKREAISRELCTIPPPVPACDVNFNRLLEERASVIDELQRLRHLLASGADAEGVLRFSQGSLYVSDEVKQRVDEMLRMPMR